jgi:hypothetical protein
MILRPEQVRQLAAGQPRTPANFKSGGNQSTASNTTNNYADRRNAVQNGIGVSGDNNSTSYFSVTNSSDYGAIGAGITAAIQGTANAINGMGQVSTNAMNANGAVSVGALNAMGATATNANNVVGAIANSAINANGAVTTNAMNTVAGVAGGAVSNMASVSQDVVSASNHLADVGLSMLQTNTALANSLFGGTQQSVQAVTGIAQQLAATQIAAQNDNRYLIAAGLAVVAIVGFAAFSHGKV